MNENNNQNELNTNNLNNSYDQQQNAVNIDQLMSIEQPNNQSNMQQNQMSENQILTSTGIQNENVMQSFSPLNNSDNVSSLNDLNQEQSLPKVEPKPKKKAPIILIIIIAILLILGTVFCFYNFYLLNGERIIDNNVKKIFAIINEYADNIDKNTLKYDIDKDVIGVEGSFKVSSDFKNDDIDLTKLKNYSFNYNGVIDDNNNKISSGISLTKNNDSILSIDGYIDNKDLLIKSEQLCFLSDYSERRSYDRRCRHKWIRLLARLRFRRYCGSCKDSS